MLSWGFSLTVFWRSQLKHNKQEILEHPDLILFVHPVFCLYIILVDLTTSTLCIEYIGGWPDLLVGIFDVLGNWRIQEFSSFIIRWCFLLLPLLSSSCMIKSFSDCSCCFSLNLFSCIDCCCFSNSSLFLHWAGILL